VQVQLPLQVALQARQGDRGSLLEGGQCVLQHLAQVELLVICNGGTSMLRAVGRTRQVVAQITACRVRDASGAPARPGSPTNVTSNKRIIMFLSLALVVVACCGLRRTTGGVRTVEVGVDQQLFQQLLLFVDCVQFQQHMQQVQVGLSLLGYFSDPCVALFLRLGERGCRGLHW
jgi:hypothetical protein